jgi:hypothetical protein
VEKENIIEEEASWIPLGGTSPAGAYTHPLFSST